MSGKYKHVDVKEDATMEDYLTELFSLQSSDQLQPVDVEYNIGYGSKQSKYTVTLNDATVKHIFVKNVTNGVGTQDIFEDKMRRLTLENEITMYTTFLPEISRFLEEHEARAEAGEGGAEGGAEAGLEGGAERLSNQFKSCLVEFHGHYKTKTSEYLILEDYGFRDRKYSMKMGDNMVLKDCETVIRRMGMMYGIFYSWKELKHPNISVSELTQLYSAFQFSSVVHDAMTLFQHKTVTSELVSLTVKVIKSLLEDDPTNPKLKARCNLASLDRLVALFPALALLVGDLQKPRGSLWFPIFGDVHTGNLAIADNSEDVIFVDFGIFRLASPMQEFQRFTGLFDHLDDHIDHLLDIYISSFTQTAGLFGVTVSSELLMAEYTRTKPVWLLMRMFGSFLMMQFKDYLTGLNELKTFVETVKKADTRTAAGRQEIVEALDSTESTLYTDYIISGWVMTNQVVDTVNKVESQLASLETRIDNTYRIKCFSLRIMFFVVKFMVVVLFRY